MAVFPSVFVSHGAPTLALDDGPARRFLCGLGEELGRPEAILCISAHWETIRPAASTAEQPETIHDFYGFPAPLYALDYPATGAPALARRAAELLGDAGLACDLDPGRGLDHGAWVPLLLMYPEADVAVTQLAIQHGLEPAHHYALGRALSPLRREGVLVLASGGLTHNLEDALGRMRGGGALDGPAPEWAIAFDAWVEQRIAAGAYDDLVDYRRRAPHAARAHPRDEHFLPLLAAAGAAGDHGPGRRLHSSFTFGSLSMAAYAFGG